MKSMIINRMRILHKEEEIIEKKGITALVNQLL